MKHLYDVTMAINFRCDVQFDSESPSFKEALASYRDVIDRNASIEDMVKHVVWNVYYRNDQDVEGVGHVLKDGDEGINPKFNLSGINCQTYWDEVSEFEIDWKK